MNKQPLSTNTYKEQVTEERTFTENKQKLTATSKENSKDDKEGLRNGALQPKGISTAKVLKWKQGGLSTWGGTRWHEMGVAEEVRGASGVYDYETDSDARK